MSEADKAKQFRAKSPARPALKYGRLRVPPTLVIENISKGHESEDRVVKRRYYEEAAIPNYWMLDVYARSLECLVLKRGNMRSIRSAGERRTLPRNVSPDFRLIWEKSGTIDAKKGNANQSRRELPTHHFSPHLTPITDSQYDSQFGVGKKHARIWPFRRKGEAVKPPVQEVQVDEDETRYKPIEWPLLKRVIKNLMPYKGLYGAGLGLGVVMLILDMQSPRFMQHIIDHVAAFASGARPGMTQGDACRRVLYIVLIWAGVSAIARVLEALCDSHHDPGG